MEMIKYRKGLLSDSAVLGALLVALMLAVKTVMVVSELPITLPGLFVLSFSSFSLGLLVNIFMKYLEVDINVRVVKNGKKANDPAIDAGAGESAAENDLRVLNDEGPSPAEYRNP